jgi:enoyl-CoA hydratase
MIERDDRGDVAVLRLARDDGNALDVELLRELFGAFRELAGGDRRAVVLAGGEGAFSEGIDLGRYLDGGPHYVHELLPLLGRALEAVFTCPLPVVAAVTGRALGAGFALACAADRRVMTDEPGARVGLPDLEIGTPLPRVLLEIVEYAVGAAVTRDLLFGATPRRGHEAGQFGLVDEVVGPEQVLDRALAEATRMADRFPADTFNVTKGQLHRATMERIDRFRRDEDVLAQRLWIGHQVDGWVARHMEGATEPV